MWSAHRLAAFLSDKSSASSEARNSATSMARRSGRHATRLDAPGPIRPGPRSADPLRSARPAPLRLPEAEVAAIQLLPLAARVPTPVAVREPPAGGVGGSVRMRDLMKAW